MRDTDVGFTTVLITRQESGIKDIGDLRGKTLALGSQDSGQAAILPVHFLEKAGLVPDKDVKLHRINSDLGKHGDTGNSEMEGLKALLAGKVDAAAMGDSVWAAFLAAGAVTRAQARPFWTSEGYCHCNFTALESLDKEVAEVFTRTLLAMKYEEPTIKHMMDLEGLKAWVPGRTTGYEMLTEAMTKQGLL